MRPTRFALLVLPLLLFACGGDDGGSPVAGDGDRAGAGAGAAAASPAPSSSPESDALAGAPTGTVSTDAGDYVFEATTCVLDADEGEINGPGTAPDGTPVYVDLSVGDTYGYVTIEVGTDEQFTGSDDTLHVQELDHEISGSRVTGRGELADGAGSLGEAEIDVDCG